MAEIAVSFLLGQITPFLREEATLLGSIREEVEDIRDELERMRAFLRVADAKEEIDPELQVWVKQVRDVAYDTEDVLDEFMLRLESHHGHGFFKFLRKISYSIKSLKARRRIASKIRRIKSRVDNISKAYQGFHDRYGVLERGSSSIVVSNSWHDRRADALLLEEAGLVGIDKPKKQIIGWLLDGDSHLKVVSVVGMGGLGKTTLVKKVYDDTDIKKEFQMHAWITVSDSYRIEKLLKLLIRQIFKGIGQPLPQGLETMDNTELKQLIKDRLQQSRYVIVLDDVWSSDAWNDVKYALPNSNCGSRILLTSRNSNVASTALAEYNGNTHELQALSQPDSWTLFCRKTFPDNNCPPHLKELSESILEKCGGLPLAIVAVAGVLATKDKSRTSEWEMVRRCLGDELEGNESMKRVLSLSYYDLPYYLKICWLYLSIIPEDYKMGYNRLIRLWSAEGFVQVRKGKTSEEVAESYLNELINRSLVQVAYVTPDGRFRRFRIHDVLREIVLLKLASEQNIVVIANKESTSMPDKVRRLAIHSSSLENIHENKCFNRLRSLILFGMTDSLSNSSLNAVLSGGSRLVRVLDLKYAPLEKIPDEVFDLLQLRYLCLRGTNLKWIPKSIGKLHNLETLDLRNTYVTELPAAIARLSQLRHLLVYRYGRNSRQPDDYYVHGFKAPADNIGGFSSLEKLAMIEADRSSGIPSEVGRLTKLRRLGMIKLKREDGMALCSSLEKLTNLRTLLVESRRDEIIDLQYLSSAPQFLQRLYLRGRLENVPLWIPSLHNLQTIALENSRLKNDDPLQSFQDLPNLVFLRLRCEAYDGEELRFHAKGFQKLRQLELNGLQRLRRITVEEGSMPQLAELLINNRVELVGIQYLAQVKLVLWPELFCGKKRIL